MTRPVHVRAARPNDARALAPLLGEVGFPETADAVEARIRAMIRTDDLLLVAVRDERPIGILTVHLTPLLHRPVPVGRLTLLVVAPNARGEGVGRALVEAAESELARRGCTIVEVISNRRYASSHGFYERMGYELTSYKFRKSLHKGR